MGEAESGTSADNGAAFIALALIQLLPIQVKMHHSNPAFERCAHEHICVVAAALQMILSSKKDEELQHYGPISSLLTHP